VSFKLSRAVLVAALISVVAPIAVPAPAGAQSTSELRKKRSEVQRKRAEAASQVDALKASDSQLTAALDKLDANVSAQAAKVADANRALDVAKAHAASLSAREQETAKNLVDLRTTMKSTAIAAYVRGPGQALSVALDARTLSDVTARQQFLRAVASRNGDTADAMRAAREDLGIQRDQAEQAREEATKRQEGVRAKLGDLRDARNLKERLAQGVEVRLERALAESSSLALVDRQLADQIAQGQAALALRLSNTGGAPGRAPRASRSGSRSGAVSVVSVRGITVAASIADSLERLLAAAESDGLNFSGGGYRSSDAQAATRRANCGSSDYDVYDKPASQCRPPTARPGQSMHEQGLAVDFTSGGSIVSSRSSPAFRWLSNNGGRFGFYNLPSEPWHWSTNGN